MDLDQLLALYAAGSDELADALRAYDPPGPGDSASHLRVAQIAESVGDVSRAVLEYNRALMLDINQPEVLWRLAHLRLDQGRVDRAVRCLQRLVEQDPRDARARGLLADLLQERGAQAAADELRVPASQALGVRQTGSGGPRRAPHPAAGDGEEEGLGAVPTDSDCVLFTHLFGGHEGAYARQWASPSGKHGYTPVHEPFTALVARHHLMGDYTVGTYALRSDNSVLWLCLDVDIAKVELVSARTRADVTRLQRCAQDAAVKLIDTCARHGVGALLEDSGNKGRHVWVLFDVPVPAVAARDIGRFLVAETAGLPREVQVEVFPKQTRPGKRGLSNLVKLPLGIHRLTGRRCPLIDTDGRPLGRPFEALRGAPRLQRAQVEALYAAVREHPLGPDEGASLGGGAQAQAAELVTTVPEGPAYDLAQDDEVSWLRARCGVLNEIIGRAETRKHLTNREREVLTYTLGHATRGAEAVNAVLAGVLNVDRSALLKSPLRGNPTSCPKIRSRLPDIAAAVGCRCRFDVPASYPHPMLHLLHVRGRKQVAERGEALKPAEIERLVRDWFKIAQDVERLTALRSEVERALRAAIERSGPLQLATGRLELDGAGGLQLTGSEVAGSGVPEPGAERPR